MRQVGFRVQAGTLAGRSRTRTALVLGAALVALAWPDGARAGIDVVVTSKPIHSLVAAVMGDVGDPHLLISGAQSPHTYALKPSDAAAVARAAVVFRISADIEPFTVRLFQSLPKGTRRESLATSPGVRFLPVRTGGSFAGRDGHDHGHKGGGRGDAGPKDAHVWLDPGNARAMVAEIARVLSRAAPPDAARFAANAATVTARLDALDGMLVAQLAPLAGQRFVVFHDAIQYFERRYGLTAVGAIVAHPDAAPSARRLVDVRVQVRSAGVACVLAEPQISARLVAAVREGTSARVGVIDPEGTQLTPGAELYFTLMRALAANLAGCLKPA